jgi:hypothetical protein
MILPKVRDPRFITFRRGGTLTDADHRLLALWAASCAQHVLGLFESAQLPEAIRSSYLMTRGCATTSAGRSSTIEAAPCTAWLERTPDVEEGWYFPAAGESAPLGRDADGNVHEPGPRDLYAVLLRPTR